MRSAWITRKALIEGGLACGTRRSFSEKKDLRWPSVPINPFGVVYYCFWQKYPTGWALPKARVLSCSMFVAPGIGLGYEALVSRGFCTAHRDAKREISL